MRFSIQGLTAKQGNHIKGKINLKAGTLLLVNRESLTEHVNPVIYFSKSYLNTVIIETEPGLEKAITVG